MTAITVSGSRDGLGFYTGPVTVTLSASDQGAGVLRTAYSVDGGATWLPYSGPVTVRAEEVPMFFAESVDRAGNYEHPWPTVQLRPDSIMLPVIVR